MRIEKFHVYLADLNPQKGTEPGKIRPVVVVQTDLLNNVHPRTMVCPITTKVVEDSTIAGKFTNRDSRIKFLIKYQPNSRRKYHGNIQSRFKRKHLCQRQEF